MTTPKSGNNSGDPGAADDPTIDAGYVPILVSIGNYLWLDTDGDGVRDPQEKPVPGATIELLDLDGTVLATTTTDQNGYYTFTDLPPNTSFVLVFPTTVMVDGVIYKITRPGQGTDPSTDSDADPSTGRVTVTTPAVGGNSGTPGQADVPTIGSGYLPLLVSIGDYVWLDDNGNGVQDPAERPVAGATIQLVDAHGSVLATTTTDPNGFYVFPDLLPATKYGVVFPTTVTVDGKQHQLTIVGRGTDPALDSNPDQGTGIAWVTTPATGDNSAEAGNADDPTIDAGYAPVASKPLPNTGVDAAGMLTNAMLLLLAGAALVVIGRRRKQMA